jgi:glyoxylase-like metal-dependent hydrolase (beta-lactamase superfamily II)
MIKETSMKAEVGTQNIPLKWDVFVTPSIPAVTSDLPPGAKQRLWPPMSSTLISGKRDAVLVDAFITVAQASALADWVAASGKNLTTIYATHGHGDHFFGAGTVLKRFPGARLMSTPDVVKIMRQQASRQSLASFWKPLFPGQISDQLVIAEELSGNVIDLEGHDLVAVPLGNTDTENTTCLHVPSIGLVIAGDAAYNGVHLHLSESNPQTRRDWIAALGTIEALNPTAVIAGHKRPENDDSPRIIEETRRYIRDFERITEQTGSARDLYDKMLEIYPDRLNPGALWSSARGVKPYQGDGPSGRVLR